MSDATTNSYRCTEGCAETFIIHEEWLAHEALHLKAENARLRETRYCGCAWCCSGTAPEQRGETHKQTCRAALEEEA